MHAHTHTHTHTHTNLTHSPDMIFAQIEEERQLHVHINRNRNISMHFTPNTINELQANTCGNTDITHTILLRGTDIVYSITVNELRIKKHIMIFKLYTCHLS